MTDAELENIAAGRMSDGDFTQRDPDWGKNNSAPSSSGIAVWDEADRARKSEALLLAEVRRLRALLVLQVGAEREMEREACAQICDDAAKLWDETVGPTVEVRSHEAQSLAALIRARGGT